MSEGVTLEIEDDGLGFDVLQSFPGHLGLRSMQERAAKIGAAWEIDSEQGRGTRIHVFVPAVDSGTAGPL